MGRAGPSIIDRLMRRGRKEKEEATDDSDHPPRSSDEPSKEPSSDPQGDTDAASGDEAGDVLTISEGAGAGGDDANVSSDDASDTDGDVLTIGDGSTAGDDTDDSNVSTGDAATDDSSGVVTADEGDALADDSSGVVTADEGDDITTGDDDQSAVDDNAQGGDTDTGASISEGDGDISTGGDDDQNVVTGDDNQQVIDEGDPDQPPQEADYPSRAELGLERADVGRIGAPQESDLAQELRLIKNVTEPQLDPEVIEARLGGRGPQPPDPDDTPDDLSFGKGALQADPSVGDVTTSELEAVDDGTDPIAANPPEDGTDPLGPALSDTGLDPVGGAPPDDGLGPHEVRIDDTTPQNEPTEVDID